MATIKKAQPGGLIRKGLRIINPAKDAAAARKVVKKIKKTETPFDKKVAKEIAPIEKKIDINKYNDASAKPVVLTPEQKANNARILKEIKEGKRKNGGSVPKAQPGRLIRSAIKRVTGEAKNIYKGKNLTPEAKEAMKRKPSKSNIAKSVAKKELTTPSSNSSNPDIVGATGVFNKASERLNRVLKRQYPDLKRGGKVGKMRNGGSLSGLTASNKRMGPVDPKGAFTKVQKKTLRGARGKASLTKDKQLGATKMAKRGMSIKKK